MEQVKQAMLEKLFNLIEYPGNVLEVVTQSDGSAALIEVPRRAEHGKADIVRHDGDSIIELYQSRRH